MKSSERLYGLDGVRGLCAIGVMVYHYGYHAFGLRIAGLGTFTVYLFFALSGFVLYEVYGRKTLSESMLKDFFVARFFRIFPLYATIAFLVFCYGTAMNGVTYDAVTKLLLNVTFLFGITNPGANSSVIGGWSIGVEFAFYILFPLLLLFRNIWVMATLTMATLVISQIYQTRTGIVVKPDQSWTQITQPASYLCFFIGGIFASMVFQKTREQFIVPVFVPLILLGIYAALPTIVGQSTTSIRSDFLLWSLVVVGSGIITFLAASAKHGIYAARVATFLGDISFALYLLHFYILRWLSHWFDAPPIVMLVISGIVSIIAAKLVHDYFEAPMRRYGRRFTRAYTPSNNLAVAL